MRSTNSSKLERWLGTEQINYFSEQMKNWYGPPIALAGVPGNVYACRGGDFCGSIDAGSAQGLADYSESRIKKIIRQFNKKQQYRLHAGFVSLSDLINETTVNSTKQVIFFCKTKSATTDGLSSISSWNLGGKPFIGSSTAGGSSGTGRITTSSIINAFPLINAEAGKTLHLTKISASNRGTTIGGLLLDRLWDMNYNLAILTTKTIDSANRPSRYQTSELSRGNFISGEVTTAFGATGTTGTITYADQDDNSSTTTAVNFTASKPLHTQPLTTSGVNSWFVPLNGTDVGVRYITQMTQATTTSMTGFFNVWIAHPIAWFPLMNDHMLVLDGINSAFNLQRIYDDACLFFYFPRQNSTSLTITHGSIEIVSG